MRVLPLLLLVGCADGEEAPDTAGCSPSWESFGQAFVIEYCDACHAATAPERHGAPESVTFDTEEEAVSWLERMVVRVEARQMPPGGGITEPEIERLKAWADCAP